MVKKDIPKREFVRAQKKMNDLLAIVIEKGGFNFFTEKESAELHQFSEIIKSYEDIHCKIALPETE